VAAEPGGRAGAVVLAAGEASRFGGRKLLMPFGDTTVIGCVVSALEEAGIDPVVVVVGAEPAGIERALARSGAQVVSNPDPGRGMFSSVRVGVAALPDRVERFLVALADQPRVRADHIARILDAHERRPGGIAIPTHGGKRGHPVVFDGRYRREVLAGGDDRSLRDIIHAHSGDILDVEIPSDAVIRDIDTPEQYEDEQRRSLAGQ
jgi:molybdenum cofactor cytidylyltransferase